MVVTKDILYGPSPLKNTVASMKKKTLRGFEIPQDIAFTGIRWYAGEDCRCTQLLIAGN